MLIGILSLFVNTEGKKKDYYINRTYYKTTTCRCVLANTPLRLTNGESWVFFYLLIQLK